MCATRPRPRIRALLIDLSGTLHVGSTPTPGAVKALSRLRQHGNATGAPNQDYGTSIPFRFCSNTSKEGRTELEQRMRSMGFELADTKDVDAGQGREMWTSLGGVSSLLQRRGLARPFCLLEPSAKEEVLQNIGQSTTSAGELLVCGHVVECLTTKGYRRRV
jgi:hypothetical protein